MSDSDEDAQIEYGIFVAQDTQEVARLLAEVFSQRDPPAVAVGLSPTEFEPLVQLLCPRAAAQGLSVVARHAGTKELVGALLTEDRASEPPDGMDRLSPKFAPIFDILGQLDAAYDAERTPQPGESMYLFLLGIADGYTGRGVAQHLVSLCLEQGAHKGYKLAVAEATNKRSQHVLRKLGFAERVQRSYLDHQYAGRAPFASIADQGGPILMDRSLLP
jgi:ribosomal protein S18 acetylase RimI-like enzyme